MSDRQKRLQFPARELIVTGNGRFYENSRNLSGQF